MTRTSRFIAVKTTDLAEDYAKFYINEIVRLYGVPLSIISDRGPQFTSDFWKSFQKGLGTQVNLSTAFHPQTNGQEERTVQTLVDTLRACVIDFKGSWDDHLPLIEFAYKNTIQVFRWPLMRLYINCIVRLHGIPLSIISDKGPQFTSHFLKSFQNGLGTQVNLSTTFHPQTDGQVERTIQTLEDMLRSCVIDFKCIWEDHVPLIEFTYTNHSNIQMAPYEGRYGCWCRSHVDWFEVGKESLIGLDLVHYVMEKV